MVEREARKKGSYELPFTQEYFIHDVVGTLQG